MLNPGGEGSATVRLASDYPTPERASGEALVRMRVAGVCDTDIQLARGYMAYSGVLGHEFVGEVMESDDPSWLGQRVVADINAGCGTCTDCVERDGHHCASRSVLGILGRDGAFAETLVVPEANLVAVPNSVTDEAAVFAEPLAAALHVVDDTSGADPIVVIGDGKLGLLIVHALVGWGAEVTLVGHHEEKLELARAIGAQAYLEAEIPTGLQAPVVVEASGQSGGLARALALTLPRGTVVLKTTVANQTGVDLSPIVINELRVVGSRCGNMQRAIETLSAQRVDPTPLITARYDLGEAEKALAHAQRPGTLKVLVANAE